MFLKDMYNEYISSCFLIYVAQPVLRIMSFYVVSLLYGSGLHAFRVLNARFRRPKHEPIHSHEDNRLIQTDMKRHM